MKMGKIKRSGALAAACMLLFLAAVPKEAYGAGAIETEKTDCSMEFSLGNDFGELDSLSIPVAVYRVAEVDVSGSYQAESAYSGLGLDGVNSGTTAADWEEMAEKAAQIAAPGALDEDGRIAVQNLPAGSRTPDAKTTVSGAEETVLGDLATGMYLVLAFTVDSAEYQYSFAPCLVSVPGNGYYDGGDDAWIYDVSVALKPDRTERFGNLEITKALDSYHAGSGASFIFQVEAQKTIDGVQTTVYSDVVQLTFDAPGSKSLLIENEIPAGASVTVTEIYKGAAYEVSGSDVQIVTVSADNTASAAFTNTYNEQLNGGSSIVNNFQPVLAEGENGEEIVENWQWTQIQ